MALLLAALALQDDVARWIEELSHESIEVRDAAERKLIEAGPAKARKSLEALTPSEEEVRVRVRRILRFFDWGITLSEKEAIDAFLSRRPLFRSDSFDRLELGPFEMPPEMEAEWEKIGARALPYLLSCFEEHLDPLVRCTALHLAGRTRDSRVLKAALPALASKDAEVRYYSLLACHDLGTFETIPSLLPLLKDATVILRRQIYGAGNVESRVALSHVACRAIERLIGYPIDPERTLKGGADSKSDPAHIQREWERLSHLGSAASIHDKVLTEAREHVQGAATPNVQLRACVHLLYFGGHDDLVFRCLLGLWKSRDSKSKAGEKFIPGLFIKAPSGFRSQLTESLFVSLLKESSSRDDWGAALGLVWAIRYADIRKQVPWKGVDEILPTLLDRKNPLEVRSMAALLATERSGVDSLIETLEYGWKEKPWVARMSLWMDGDLIRTALKALEAAEAPESRDILRRYLGSDSRCHRTYACEALAALKDDAAVPVLKELLGQMGEDSGESPPGFEALYQLNRDEAMAFVPKLFTFDQEPNLGRWSTLAFLLKQNEPIALDYYVRCIRHHSFRQGIGSSLFGMKTTVLIPRLIDLIEQDRGNARIVLSSLAPGESLEIKTVAELRAWWTKNEKTFVIDRERILKDK